MMKVAIVGGGITGLASAYYLEQFCPGLEMDLYEADTQLGGHVRTDTRYGVVIEGGPDSFLATKTDLVELCERIGLGSRLIGTNPRVKGAYIFWNDRFYTIPEGIQSGVPTKAQSVLTSPLLSLSGKVALLKDFIVRRGPHSDQSLGRFLRRHFGNQLVDRLAAPMLSGIFAGDIDQMSLHATFPHLLAAEKRSRSVYLGSRRRESPSPNTFVKRYHSVFLTVDRGLEHIVMGISQALRRTHTILGIPVTHIEPGNKRAWSVAAGELSAEYDAVIVSTPAFVSARLMPFLPQEATSILQNIPYADLAVMGAVYDPEDIPIKTDKTGFLIPRQQGMKMTAVTWVSSKWHYPYVRPDFVLRAFFGRMGENILDHDDETLEGLFRDEIRRTMHITRDPGYLRIFRIPRGMPQYVVGHLERMATLRRYVASYPHLYVIGAFDSGVGMPDRVKQAKETAEKLGHALESSEKLPNTLS